MPPRAATACDPVGVFDSGVGGLSVLREIHAQWPQEALLYVADSGHAPYGEKSADFIEARALHIIDHLLSQDVKAIVVACNTITGLIIDRLRQHFPGLLIVAIEPAVKPAALVTRSGVVGVLATRQTIASPGLARLIQAHGQGRQFLLQACPGWVERVEAGALDDEDTQALLDEYVQPLLSQGADTLVLGCTHYPFLAHAIRRLAGPGIEIIDPAAAVARELGRRLQHMELMAPITRTPKPIRFWTSGNVQISGRVASRLWGALIEPMVLPEDDE